MRFKTKFSILLAVGWLLPALLLAQNELTYTTNNGVITIKGFVGARLGVTNVVIPDNINGYPVTRIGTNAFKSCTLLTNVVISSSVTIIEGGTFDSCSGLKSLTIPAGVPGIVDYTFFGCSGLRSMVIPNSVTNIGSFAFYGCSSLTNITFLGDAPSLGVGGVFTGVPATVYYWFGTAGWGAAFYGGLPAVALSNPLTFTTNNGAITITGYVGSNLNVRNVVIPANLNGYPVTSIRDYAFNACTSLTNVFVPNTMTNIGYFAFFSCPSLTNITVHPESVGYSSTNGVLFNKMQTTLVMCPKGLRGSYAVPASVTNIGDYAFIQCDRLTNVVIGTNVTGIGNNAFQYCSSLTNVVIPDGVVSIGGSAFMFCSSLTSVVIPSSVTSIGGTAFTGCSSLTSVLIPNSVTNIGVNPFTSCTSLTNIAVDAANTAYSNTNGALFDKTQAALIAFPAGIRGGYLVPDSVADIGGFAFYNCSSLTSVVIPNCVTNIGNQAFFNCISLTNVVIGNSVSSVEFGAFIYCSSLMSITFGGNAPAVELNVFNGVATGAKVYYYYGTSGWGTTYGGVPTVMLGAPAPQIGGSGSVGIQSGNFEFTISGASGQGIVVEASTNLVNWQPVWTSRLTGATTNFIDSEWINFPTRFYRAR
jgi:hypothetical protein